MYNFVFSDRYILASQSHSMARQNRICLATMTNQYTNIFALEGEKREMKVLAPCTNLAFSFLVFKVAIKEDDSWVLNAAPHTRMSNVLVENHSL